MTDKDIAAASWIDPLSHPVPVAIIPPHGLEISDELDILAREKLAKALDLAGIQRLSATYKLMPRAGGIIAVTGELRGLVRPVCVVTLEPFDLPIREAIDLRFADPADERRKPRRIEDEDILASDDPPDEIENGVIDLGRITTEFLSLAIPPFPRKGDVAFAETEVETPSSPFGALAKLKQDK